MTRDERWLSASDCAKRTGLTVRALRVYEREGLLYPARSSSGWRRYSANVPCLNIDQETRAISFASAVAATLGVRGLS